MKVNTVLKYSINNKADNISKNPKTGEYSDPLMHWPLRGAAYTNEIGEALRPVIGSYATLSWAPALLYIGADIYDKYKNDKTEYSPNSHRALKQAIFQGMASIFLPLVAVKFGQNLFSLFGYLSKDKIKFNDKELVNNLAEDFIANGNMRAYRNNDNECVAKFIDIVSNNTDYNNTKLNIKIFKQPLNSIEKRFTKNFYSKKQKNISNYAEKTILSLIKLRKDLLNPSDEFKISEKYLNYCTLLDNGQTKNVAVKNILIKNVKKNTIQGKVVKTVGGFLALGLAMHPIDKFVENVLIGKVIEPKLEKKRPV